MVIRRVQLLERFIRISLRLLWELISCSKHGEQLGQRFLHWSTSLLMFKFTTVLLILKSQLLHKSSGHTISLELLQKLSKAIVKSFRPMLSSILADMIYRKIVHHPGSKPYCGGFMTFLVSIFRQVQCRVIIFIILYKGLLLLQQAALLLEARNSFFFNSLASK